MHQCAVLPTGVARLYHYGYGGYLENRPIGDLREDRRHQRLQDGGSADFHHSDRRHDRGKSRRQAGLLRDFLRREDPEAFLTIVNSSEIIGKGFQSV